jgi:molybdopterin-containing oxidoreductase family membrane subunit
MFVAALLINVSMWFERFVIVVSSLSADFLPSSWDYYSPTFVDVGLFVGSFGLFFTFFLLFLRFVPMIAISEVKAVLPQADPHYYNGNGHGEKSLAEKAGVDKGGQS